MSTSAIPAPPRSYSTVEIARRLGVSIQTVQRWVDAGHLKAWKTLGGHRRIDADSAERLLRHELVVDPSAGSNERSKAPSGAPAVEVLPSVLIVDDNEDDREILIHLVASALPDAQVHAVSSGFDALLHIGRQSPDILITDIVMPNMNGFEMLRHLAHECPSRPRTIWAVSNHSYDELLTLGDMPSDILFQSKPIERERFIDTLRRTVLTGPLCSSI